MANHSSILALSTPCWVWKVQKIWPQKMSPPTHTRSEVSNMLLGKSRGQLRVTSERMKWLGRSRNDLSCGCVWWWKSDAIKNIIAQEPGKLGPWMKVNWIIWLDSISDSMDKNLSKLWEIDSEGQRKLVCYSPRGHKESDMTETEQRSNNNWIVPKWSCFPTPHLLVAFIQDLLFVR